MKSLGIIRRIDDLGRIVVPKEVRKSQGWKKGEPMEMFMDGENLVMKSYKKGQEKEGILKDLEILLQSEKNGDGKEILQTVIEYVKGESE